MSVDWSAAPVGSSSPTLTIEGPGGSRVVVDVPVENPATPRPESLEGFVETAGYVSLEAEHFTRAVAPPGRSWQVIPGHGRTLSGVMTLPVTAPPSTPGTDGMRLEYAVHLFSRGTVTVHTYLAPTQKVQPGAGLRYAVSFDDEPPQVVNVHADASLPAWEKTVADGVTVQASRHVLAEPGRHTLKLWSIDPQLVLQKIVVDTGGLRPSYLGPPESPRGRPMASPEHRASATKATRPAVGVSRR